MDLSLVIVSFNTRELLAACLASVFASLEAHGPLAEVWVVDNASADGSAAMVAERFPQVRLVANDHNPGFAAANNQALARCRGRYAMLLNPDTEVRGDALTTLVRFMDDTPAAGACGARLFHGDGRFQHSAFAFPTLAQIFLDFFPLNWRLTDSRLNGRYPRRLYERGQPFAVDHPLGAALLVRREAMDQVGLLDDGFFMYCEEIDWCLRIKRAGWGIYCVPRAEVVHHVAQSTRQFRDAMFVALWRSRYRLFDKHYSAIYRWAARRVVRLGLWWAARQARAAARRGELSAGELAGRLVAYREVAKM